MMYLCFLGEQVLCTEEELPIAKTFRKIMDGSGEDYNWEYFREEFRMWRIIMVRKYKGKDHKLEQEWRSLTRDDLLDFARKYWNRKGTEDGEA